MLTKVSMVPTHSGTCRPRGSDVRGVSEREFLNLLSDLAHQGTSAGFYPWCLFGTSACPVLSYELPITVTSPTLASCYDLGQ